VRNAPLLNALIRDELLEVIDQYGLLVDDRRRRETLLVAVAQLSNAQLRTVLKRLPRDRLKDLCRILGLDETSKLKSELVSRLLDEPFSPDEEDEDGRNIAVPNDNAEKSSDDKPPVPDTAAKRLPVHPRLFIGSTAEALLVAQEVQAELDRDFEVTIWSQSLFGPGNGTWMRLVEMARSQFDFALFVFSADDMIESRGVLAPGPRDNVLLEYGLFVGALGLDKAFFLYNRDKPPKLASDLSGITALTYRERSDGNTQAAVGPACTSLRKLVKANQLQRAK
jgi:predicted nucleotide-binding protein